MVQNPFESPEKWESIADRTNEAVAEMRADAKPFTERSIRERFALVLASYIKEDMASLKR